MACKNKSMFTSLCNVNPLLVPPWYIMKIHVYITKTYLYNFDPRKPHSYIVKLGLQEYTLFLLFLLQNIDCGTR